MHRRRVHADDADAWPRCCPMPVASTSSASEVKNTCVDAGRHRQAAAGRAPYGKRAYATYEGVRQADQRAGSRTPHDAARHCSQFKPIRPRRVLASKTVEPAKEIRQTLRHRRDVAGLDLHGSPHDAGFISSDESHRWQSQHRRGRTKTARRYRNDRRACRRDAGTKVSDVIGAKVIESERDRAIAKDGPRFAALSRIKQVASGALRRHHRVPGASAEADPDQDGARCQAGRRRSIAGPARSPSTSLNFGCVTPGRGA